MMISLTAHNLPEGMAVAVTTMSSVHAGGVVALAIALHNIPEGIVISVPVFAATGDRLQALKWSFMSGLSEPLGAILGLFVLRPFLTEDLLSDMLCFVAGMMTTMSVSELIPAALKYEEPKSALFGFFCGCLIMLITSEYA
eukprot:c25682_g1_i1.p1 GENE.c25682_g1_i1~~c25682_g1_i1.p1  ORF type:complete len:141 (-),score=52.65 c25682_g1_i1:26-448(-)